MAVIEPSAATVRPRGRTRRRWLQAALAAAMTLGTIGLTAGPASAERTCTGARDANLCLTIEGLGNGFYRVHVGIDVHMSFEEAQEYIDDPGDPLTAVIRGDDSGRLAELLFGLPLVHLGADPEFGLGADFDTIVPGRLLDEDRGADQDEVRAVVTLTDTDTNTVRGTFVSGPIRGNWS
ncbi:hypothetical protein FKR81_33200 [Lentzea tibetensis]|uniref:Uncharacterized protein n=1 Tax=Lentzea tibetensis TaxID=2591470 RepID=A0A563EKA7_9PSEU|nr:hypothetical protein [Lentzea tibetensis]TWP47306.1 hypothetical protein FKR81_33200 [Lentzea tibetensis]